jgi:hypothetical protein
MRRPFQRKRCVDLSPQAQEVQRRFSVPMRIEITEACLALCDGKRAAAEINAPDRDLARHVVNSWALRYRRRRPGDYSPKCGRSLTMWVERIEPA